MAEILEIIIKAVDQFSKPAENITGKLKNIGSSMTQIGGIMTAAVTAPIVAGFGASIKAASDMEESTNKVKVVFGEAADEVLAFSKTAATSLGMSSQQAIDATGTFGNLFTAMGIGKSTSADMSTSIVQLASDLASFNNMDPSEVLEKLRAGLVGETEPLRTLGVNLNQATIEAKAMAMGLWDGNGAIDAAAKAQASYALILEQTKTAQGDFARTADGLANSTRIAKAELADAAAQIGTLLLPVALQLATALRDLLSWFTGLSPEIQKTIVVVLGIVAALGPLLIVAGQVATAIGALMPVFSAVAAFLAGPLALAVGLIIVIVAGMVASWINMWNGLKQIWAWMTATFGPLWSALANLLSAVVGVAVTALTGLWQKVLLPALQEVWAFLEQVFGPAFRTISNILDTVFGPAIKTAKGILDGLKGAFDAIGNAINNVIGWINDLADKLRNLKLPDWLTPGSPTPFELGLRGIGEAMEELNTTGLPAFQAGLMVGGGARNTSYNYNLTINEAGGRGNIVNDFGLLKALAGA